MKKILAILLAALMMTCTAVAEQEMQAWNLTVDQITVTHKGETVEMNPTLEIAAGADSVGMWSEFSVLLSGASVITGQCEYVNDTLFGSIDGANDALLIEGADMFLNQYGISGERVKAYVNALFRLLNTGVQFSPYDHSAEKGGFDVQLTGENEAIISYERGSSCASARVSWKRAENKLPYDLSDKNICRYTYREMFPGDGTDIPEAAADALAKLMNDASIQALAELFSVSISM